MIEYVEKNVVDVGMGIVAHGVNCQGKMASGVAKDIRAKWPIVYEAYMEAPKGGAMLGTCHLIAVNHQDSLWVANCYTQQFYGYGGGKYADSESVERSLENAAVYADIYGLPIFMPRIGCGLGGLDWDKDVLPALERITEKYNRVDMIVCDLPIGK